MSFVDNFIKKYEEAESPTAFWKWAAYATIAAILRDNVWYDSGVYKTYPNIYVVLLADSAESRKSVPLNKASDLLFAIKNTKIIQGRASIQQVIEDLSSAEMDKKTGNLIKGGSCILIAGELSAFFVDDPQSIRILTDLYDYKQEYVVALKSGKSKVSHVCLSMLAASNETLLKEVYNNKAVYGGLLGRTFFIKPDEFRAGNSLLRVDIDKYRIDKLVEEIQILTKFRGAMQITDAAYDLYDTWYKKLRAAYKLKKDKTGILGRIHVGVLKISMILAISDHRDTTIQECCVEKAINDCSQLLANYEEYATAMGQSSVAQIGSVFLSELWAESKKILSRREFLLRHWADFSAKDFDELLVTLEQAGMIEMVMNGAEIGYRMTGKCTKIFADQIK